jgi:type I restriction-modification system DNA methylase subunit
MPFQQNKQKTAILMQKAFETIKQLVADFKAQEAAYLSPSYQESRVRQDFIDKFFTALGWDVTHERQKNPYEQEVHIENKVSMAGSQRRADYAFFLAPNFRNPKFFVEAKKPQKNLANAGDYHQTIRYGWNAGTPLAILTDFEEFHILDCRYKPNIDEALNHKIEYFHYSDYANEEKFARLYWLFSREAVAGGSIEKRAAELPKPRGGGPRGKAVQRGLFKGGYQPVDEAFLEELDGYREQLAKAFKKANEKLEGEELTEAIQRTLDRLVFIRFLEDKQIEEPEIINLRSRESAWKGFLNLCKRMDSKYNGLVFKPHRVIDSKEFEPPDDTVFANICNELADPASPYNFDQIPISILGSIYERFLGKVVHATDKRVKVEEKQEVRKAGGVYYTPEYIVRYIVNETVGKLLYVTPSASTKNVEPTPPCEGGEKKLQGKISSPQRGEVSRRDRGVDNIETPYWKTPEQVAKMAFADIACGSGSFLIEVYSTLLEYHIRYYIEHPEKVKEGDVFEREGKLHLSLKKKKEILTNNIYGVDIDFQATEVTQLSLYLKMLEEATITETHQFGMFKEAILPDLRKNIINGNSLIGTDIYDGDLFAMTHSSQSFPNASVGNPEKGKGLDPRQQHAGMTKEVDGGVDKLKPMNFEDAFPNVMKRGGFDAVVGNPPYGFHQIHSNDLKPYFKQHFRSSQGSYENYLLFYERSLSLLKKEGQHGFIVPVTWLTIPSAHSLRKYVLDNFAILQICWLPELVFKNAQVNTLISIIEKSKPDSTLVNIYDSLGFLTPPKSSFKFSQNKFINADYYIGIFENDIDEIILKKILKLSQRLDEIGRPCSGYNPYEVGKGKAPDGKPHTKETVETKPYHSETQKSAKWKAEIIGRDLSRYSITVTGKRWIKYGPWLSAPRDPDNFVGKRILVQEITGGKERRIVAAYYDGELYHSRDVIPIKMEKDSPKPFYVLGLLNSKLMVWFHHKRNPKAQKGLFPKVLVSDLAKLPIRTINFDDPTDKTRHDAIVKLVEQMLEAKEKLSNAKTEAEVNRLEMLCQSLDRQIDEAVYELYGLTEEEIGIVEGTNQ